MIKGNFTKALGATAIALTLGACSSMTTIAERDEYAQPKWYANCAQAGTEGYFWWKQGYAYACGAGESRHGQASEAQAYMFASNSFARRINGTVNSNTEVTIINERKQSSMIVSESVTDTRVTQHTEEERGIFKYAGKHYTFVKLKMPIEVFDALVNEATNVQISSNN
jgi:hypothetical protein